MIEAYILLTLEADKIPNTLREILKKVPEITEAKGLTGPYDGILHVRAKNLKELTLKIVPAIYKIDGVIDTTTAIVIDSED